MKLIIDDCKYSRKYQFLKLQSVVSCLKNMLLMTFSYDVIAPTVVAFERFLPGWGEYRVLNFMMKDRGKE